MHMACSATADLWYGWGCHAAYACMFRRIPTMPGEFDLVACSGFELDLLTFLPFLVDSEPLPEPPAADCFCFASQ